MLAQHPHTTVAPSMPQSAIEAKLADFVLPLDVLGCAIVALVMVPGAPQLFGLPALEAETSADA